MGGLGPGDDGDATREQATHAQGGVGGQVPALEAEELAIVEGFCLSGFYDPWFPDETMPPPAPPLPEPSWRRN